MAVQADFLDITWVVPIEYLYKAYTCYDHRVSAVAIIGRFQVATGKDKKF